MQKPSPFRFLLLVVPVILVVLAAFFFRKEMSRLAGLDALTPSATNDPASTENPVEVEDGIQKALELSLEDLKAQDPGFVLYNVKIDNIEYAEDGNTAMVWLAVLDPETSEILAGEPEIAIAKRNPEGQKGTADEWTVVLPHNAEYAKVVEGLPKGLLGSEFEQRFQTKYPESKVVAKFGGYYLPWGGGQKKRVTWSISHASCSGNDCKYAFDFADGTMFPILAAKGGTVFAAQWTCSNGSTKCTNYIILKDNSTTPTSYQIYYHLAKESTPAALRKPGAVVNQGTYIGNADDTGASTAHHLHFMVHTSSYGYWGPAADITFKDVSINYDSVTKGGRPRTVTEASKYGGQGATYYTSGNKAAKGPTGSISAPAEGSVITSRTVAITGTGKDDKGVTKAQLMAYFDNAWHDVGAAQTKFPFTLNFDMCATGAVIPDGPVSFALMLWDVEGNQSVGLQGLKGVVKNFACTNSTPPPPCNPVSDEVSIYSGVNYTGVCKTFKTGDYVNPAAMKGFLGDDVESILVGSNAQVTAWAKASYTSRGETLVTSDPDLGDNLINRNNINSFKVRTHATAVAAPSIVSPTNGSSLTTDDSIILFWSNNGWADEFQAEISGNNGFVTRTSEWSQGHSWNIGGLPVGSYTWKVRSRNNANHQTSGWVSASLTIKAATLNLGTAVNAPWQDSVENGINGWTKTGLWNQTTSRYASSNHSWLYGETVSSIAQYVTGKTGALTSPSIRIPSTGYYLRFVYRFNTEGSAKYWDQRWVQVSVDGGPFSNLTQLNLDPKNTWLQSPALDLSAYANKNVRVRFFFHTLDAALNTGDGWYIDDIRIDQTGPATGCNEAVSNNSLATASSISLTNPAVGDICAAGDVDYYKFTAKSGDRLTFDVDAKTAGSALDPVLTLINRDTRTVLAENDDEVAYQVKDSQIYYVMPADGEYYLKIQAWDHPMAGGSNYYYTIRLYNDNAAPTAKMVYPASGTLLPNAPINLSVSGSDANGSGIGHVVFYWHNHDWVSSPWVKIGEDWNGTDGWNYVFDPTKEAKGSLAAVYAQVFDGSGNKTGVASWALKTDPSQAPPPVPTSTMIPLPATSNLNTVLLQWTANNVGAGIASIEIQMKENGGAWQAWTPPGGIKPTDRSAWFIGDLGKTYGFRMRVVDPTGKQEPWNDAPETTVEMKACTASVDSFEADTTQAQAKTVEVDGDHLQHTFCGVGDVDWVKVELIGGEMYYFNALTLSPAVSAVLTIYDGAGNALAEQFPTQLGSPTALRWMAPVNGTFFIKARNLNPLIAGDSAAYQLWVDQGLQIFVPMVTQ